MRIAIFEVEPQDREYLSKSLAGHELSFHEEVLSERTAELAADAEAALVFVYSTVDAAVIAKMPKLRMVATRSMGYDHFDLGALAARGIVACRVPAYGVNTVAEYAFALIFALSRRIFQAYERTEKASFDYRGLMGFDLMGRTLGVVGGGRIGFNVAMIGKALGMRVLVSDPHPNADLAAEHGLEYAASLEAMLPECDVVSLHVPYMPATHHLMNERTLGLMKRGSILVNTARGGLVDTAALLKALDEGRLSGAGVDVIEGEKCFKEEAELATRGFHDKCDLRTMVLNHALVGRDDVIITPHIAWYSEEAVERILATTTENVLKFIAGEPINTVTLN
jgi:D-lactate dehydrogenase